MHAEQERRDQHDVQQRAHVRDRIQRAQLGHGEQRGIAEAQHGAQAQQAEGARRAFRSAIPSRNAWARRRHGGIVGRPTGQPQTRHGDEGEQRERKGTKRRRELRVGRDTGARCPADGLAGRCGLLLEPASLRLGLGRPGAAAASSSSVFLRLGLRPAPLAAAASSPGFGLGLPWASTSRGSVGVLTSSAIGRPEILWASCRNTSSRIWSSVSSGRYFIRHSVHDALYGSGKRPSTPSNRTFELDVALRITSIQSSRCVRRSADDRLQRLAGLVGHEQHHGQLGLDPAAGP